MNASCVHLNIQNHFRFLHIQENHNEEQDAVIQNVRANEEREEA